MDCEAASHRMYHYLDGELTVWRRWVLTRHLDRCPPCAQGFDFEIELRQVIAVSLPGPGARGPEEARGGRAGDPRERAALTSIV